jgi:hypothetical protein
VYATRVAMTTHTTIDQEYDDHIGRATGLIRWLRRHERCGLARIPCVAVTGAKPSVTSAVTIRVVWLGDATRNDGADGGARRSRP